MIEVANFENELLTSGKVIDPEGEHSEFVSGMHGQKVDFDKLDDKDPLYGQWIEIGANYMKGEMLPGLPEFIVGVANGTNRVVHDISKLMRGRVVALESEKDEVDSKVLRLKAVTKQIVRAVRPALAVVFEDVGTTGSNSVQVAEQLLEAGAGDVIVVSTWQRREHLELLEKAGIEHQAIINHPLPTFSPEDCQNDPNGFCARDWVFKARNK